MTDREKVIEWADKCTSTAHEAEDCNGCPYRLNHEGFYSCIECLIRDTVALLKEQDWVKCSDRMPEEHDSIFAKLKGTDKWRSAMFEKSSDDVRIVEVFEDGTRRVYHSHTIDGKWDIEKQPIKRTVTHWMPNPEPPKEDR